MTKLGVGRETEAMCTRCKMILNHVIVAMVGSSVKRVKCLTCGSEHNYRNPEAKSTRTKKGKEVTASRKGVLRASDFEQLMKGRDVSKPKKYKQTGHFYKDDIIEHQLFGIGLVMTDKDGKKIDVIFEDGPRVLVHNVISA